ncbi:hypothetical protein SAICODRAFT_10660 [Saitoella complicata NRRL Y-17804]|uniref:Transmembrane protein UsgS n=1 Tax=Saitoella complicata (strain BCRC 22490 / CBS 7301 / JCM 7358 / NBRC 10748 / NRRL Y-17804) TaxID=698492 RepID=A0A0E9NFE9_SAICN|nr:uncharacterized protein SAICODRAFT_10660 [Saitoella complicata NRRL Y-17804]ODQ49639.1 hypothetical protein SAICODRAFT_10660 [Saitoella complicata NRRL Y-17804]GAO48135.1 hypothetical protein G7K_2317-t1 [Saitoella complicata NRRL Y-17804]
MTVLNSLNPNAFLRGFQLTFLGTYRAIQNPSLFTTEHYRLAFRFFILGLALYILIEIPILGLRNFVWLTSWFVDLDKYGWDESLLSWLGFVEKEVLQVGFEAMMVWKYVDPAPTDELFMTSLKWVDKTYTTKHSNEDPNTLRPPYHTSLTLYPPRTQRTRTHLLTFLQRRAKRMAIGLAVFSAAQTPLIGSYAVPLATIYGLHRTLGPARAGIFAGVLWCLPKSYAVIAYQGYFASRILVNDLLSPYFTRIPFTAAQKRKWFREREGVLAGFGVGWYLLTRIPVWGVLFLGLAEGSAAFLLTKVTDAPPMPHVAPGKEVGDVPMEGEKRVETDERVREYCEREVGWRNRKKFLGLGLGDLLKGDLGMEKTAKAE